MTHKNSGDLQLKPIKLIKHKYAKYIYIYISYFANLV